MCEEDNTKIVKERFRGSIIYYHQGGLKLETNIETTSVPVSCFKNFLSPFKVTKNLMFPLPFFNSIWTGGGGEIKWSPRVLLNILNGLTDLHETLCILRQSYRSSFKIKNLGGRSFIVAMVTN